MGELYTKISRNEIYLDKNRTIENYQLLLEYYKSQDNEVLMVQKAFEIAELKNHLGKFQQGYNVLYKTYNELKEMQKKM